MSGIKVKSSNLKKVWYEKDTMTLTIKFRNGDKYDYRPISEEGFKALISAESVGKFFNEFIKNNPMITVSKVD